MLLQVDIDVAHWQKNGAGLWHSHKHGFGLMNAWRLVNAAKVSLSLNMYMVHTINIILQKIDEIDTGIRLIVETVLYLILIKIQNTSFVPVLYL